MSFGTATAQLAIASQSSAKQRKAPLSLIHFHAYRELAANHRVCAWQEYTFERERSERGLSMLWVKQTPRMGWCGTDGDEVGEFGFASLVSEYVDLVLCRVIPVSPYHSLRLHKLDFSNLSV